MTTAKNKKFIISAVILVAGLIVAGYFFFKNGGSFPFFAKKEPTKIRLAWPLSGGAVAGQIGAILQNKDFLHKNGFDETDVASLKNENDLRLALIDGEADAVLTDETTFSRILGQGFAADGIASLGTDGQMALVVAANSEANSAADLKGNPVKPDGHGASKIGVTFGTAQHKQLLDWLAGSKLDGKKDVHPVKSGAAGAPTAQFNRVNLVNVPDNVWAHTGLLSGTLDAIVDDGLSLADNSETGKYKELEQADLYSVVAVSADWAEKNPDGIKKIREALKDAIMYLVQNKQQSIAWYANYSGADQDIVSQAVQTEKIYGVKNRSDIDLSISADEVSRLNDLVGFLVDQKMVQNRPSVEDYIK
jgi:ABC-type nitrate/sulfonate/bicarbonate transport system substrate-binding protein